MTTPFPTLSDVASMPLEKRFAFVRRTGGAAIEGALGELRRDYGAEFEFLGPERVAWAIAFNVTGEGLPPPRRVGQATVRTYLDKWPGVTPWSKVLQWLTQPVAAAPGSRGGLVEFAASVACEGRDDWQYPEARPLRQTDAQQAFSSLYNRYADKVVGYVKTKFGGRAGDAENIASEAWARGYVAYWSVGATRRVLGGAAISTLVCGVAYFIAVDSLRAGRAGAGSLDAVDPESAQTPAGQVDDLAGRELAQHIRQCRKGLATRQQLVARMVWDHQVPQREVALRLGNTDAAVSQLLKRARANMAICLKKRGYSLPDEEPSDERRSLRR